jgi:hypothetical protein
MTSTATLTLVDGVRVVVPDSLHLITPYVLLERQDWFEDEIKLVPGLDLLLPFDAESVPDGYLLKLFCCKRDRAGLLAVQGFLIESPSRHAGAATHRNESVCAKFKNSDAHAWQRTVAKLPYGVQLGDLWAQTMAAGNGGDLARALAGCAASRDPALLAAALEEGERLGLFSSFYTGVSARQRLAIIASLGFASEEMGRRSHLLQRRFGPTASGLQN